MNITAVARTFLISFLVIFCLALPARAENLSAQHVTAYPLGQVTANQTGINAYRRNLNRLRSTQSEASRSQPPSLTPTAQGLSESPQPKTESAEGQPQQQTESTEQQHKFSFTKAFQKNKLQESQPEAEKRPEEAPIEEAPIKVVRERSTQPQMSAYEMVQAARQPYGAQADTARLRPNFPPNFPPNFSPNFSKVTPSQLSEQLSERASQLHTSLRQQPERINKTMVKPLQGKVAALKEQASTTAKTTFKEQIESRGLTGRELIEGSGVSDRIHQTQKSLKASMVGILKHVETKAHETAEQLNNTTR